MSTPGHDDPLSKERSHLAASRSALRAMREDVESLDITDVTANWVNAAVLEAQIEQRIKALADLSETPLFFGRLDYLHAPGAEQAEGGEGERFYVGRRHVHDADGDPMVIDWRAPVSQPFYRASKKDPQDVSLRRRFGYTGGDLTAYEDEHLLDPAEAATTSRLLQQEIERPRVGPMRDIVATIQPEQDEIVRAGLAGSVCVQGGPGTGKTAVGLHRAAYLLYSDRARYAGGGILVVGPSGVFVEYIASVLPSLGEETATLHSLGSLFPGLSASRTDPPDVAAVKGSLRMRRVL
ncbi:AAA family ATPase, partial [Nocardia sp. NPDC003354]